jgi:putative peptidoglycan lipid II flippase
LEAAQGGQGKKIALSSLKMAVATFASRILGLVREQVMAAMFGASGLTDAFTVAYRVPNMLRDLFAEGAFSSAFVPVFTEARLKSLEEARRLMWSLFVLLGLTTGIISLLIALNAHTVTVWMTDEAFRSDLERLAITVELVRMMAPFLVMVSLAALFMGALNSLKVFFVPSLAPALFNVLMIACMIWLPPWYQSRGLNPIFSMGVGVVTGGLAQLLIQVPLIFARGMRPTSKLALISPHTKRVVSRLGVGTIGIAATQINVLISTVLATGTVVGAVSWLTYAFRLFQFPIGILGVSIAGSNLVHFSDALKSGKKDEAVASLRMSYQLALMTIVPAMALLLALSHETVALVFERGAFTATDTASTALALKYYCWGLPCYGLYKIFAPTFFSLDRPRLPVGISIFCIAINIAFCLGTVPLMGFSALALGTTVSIAINALLQALFLRSLLGLSLNFFLNRRALLVLIAGVVAFFVAGQIVQLIGFEQVSLLRKMVSYGASCLGGIMTYGAILIVTGEGAGLKKLLRLR